MPPFNVGSNLKLSSQTNGFQKYGVTRDSGKKDRLLVRAESSFRTHGRYATIVRCSAFLLAYNYYLYSNNQLYQNYHETESYNHFDYNSMDWCLCTVKHFTKPLLPHQTYTIHLSEIGRRILGRTAEGLPPHHHTARFQQMRGNRTLPKL